MSTRAVEMALLRTNNFAASVLDNIEHYSVVHIKARLVSKPKVCKLLQLSSTTLVFIFIVSTIPKGRD